MPRTSVSAYYRSEAERVQRLADAAQPGRGREVFSEAAAEYRRLAHRHAPARPPEPPHEPAMQPAAVR